MELLREVMRKWVTGVSIVTVKSGEVIHGMTVGSLVSVSIDPPRIVVTLANNTRTHKLLLESGLLGITILSSDQQTLAEIFSGKVDHNFNLFDQVETEQLVEGVEVIKGGLANLACRVVHQYPMPNSTLFVCEVLIARVEKEMSSLVYANRNFHRLELL